MDTSSEKFTRASHFTSETKVTLKNTVDTDYREYPPVDIPATLETQRTFFRSGATLEISFRKKMLHNLLNAVEQWEEELSKALWEDLHKCPEEAYLTEISIVKDEIKKHLRNVEKWARREKVPTPFTLFPSQSYLQKEPLGCALIIAPWNYPVQLLLAPLIGAISAGCTAVLKPSPYVPNVSRILEEMIGTIFAPNYIKVVQGHRDTNAVLLQQRWDIIFFTGSPALGRTVMASAAQNLTPVVLELGGKSPCIIDKTADIGIASRRIAWGKTLNSGQTCIAPDYLIIHKDVKDAFIDAWGKRIKKLHGDDILESPHYVHMVNEKAFERVCSYMKTGKIAYGGRSNRETLCIEPTILEGVPLNAPVMEEEIFGPLFPMIVLDDSITSFNEKVIELMQTKEKPLALYYFGEEEKGWKIMQNTSSGGGCINDVIMHIANGNLPFGGVGNSGMGHYHGRESFECFTHTRPVLVNNRKLDTPFRYMPYKLFSLIRKLI